MNARYQDPVRGQFISEDPAVVGLNPSTGLTGDPNTATVDLGSLDRSLGAYDAAAFVPSAVIGHAAEEPMVCRLFAGGGRIRTIGPA